MNMMCKYDKVISSLPPLVMQNINARAPSRFKWWLDTMISEINDITVMQKTMLLWDNAHYTQNDNHALSSWCFRRWRLSNRGFCWQGWKPVIGNKDKTCTRALGFKTEVIIYFRSCMLRQRMLADNSITSWDGQVSRNGSRMRTITSS